MKEAVTLEYDRGLKAFPFGATAVLLVTMFSVLAFIDPDPEGYPDGVWIFLVFVFLGIVLPWLLFIEVFGTRVVLNGDGVKAESWWRGTRFLRWQEIGKVHYSSFSNCIVLKGERGKIRVNPLMLNIDRLLTVINEMVPNDRIQKNLEVFVRHLRLE